MVSTRKIGGGGGRHSYLSNPIDDIGGDYQSISRRAWLVLLQNTSFQRWTDIFRDLQFGEKYSDETMRECASRVRSIDYFGFAIDGFTDA